MFTSAQPLLETAIKNHLFPGAVLGVVDATGKSEIIAVGTETYEENARPVKSDALFDVASLTKAIPTSTLASMLIAEGRLTGKETLASILPEFTGEGREVITINDLLNFRIAWKLTLSEHKDESPEQLLQTILSATIDHDVPSGTPVYSNTTSILLGRVLEKVTGESLASLAYEKLWLPLNMRSTFFHSEQFDKSRAVPTENDPWRGRTLQGEVHDESAWKLRSLFTAGSAGLFTTMPDLLQFARWKLQTSPGSSVGWETYSPSWMGKGLPDSTYGKTGFTGCSILFLPQQKRALVLLSNTVHPQRPASGKEINALRSRLAHDFFTESVAE